MIEACLLLIYNNRDDSIFVARDTFGIKPLFYHKLIIVIFISSEKKSFFTKIQTKNLTEKLFINISNMVIIKLIMTLFFQILNHYYLEDIFLSQKTNLTSKNGIILKLKN